MAAMDADRRIALIVGAGHTGKLALNLGMDTARFVETESDVQKQSALRTICMIRDELDQLEASIIGKPLRIPSAPLARAV